MSLEPGDAGPAEVVTFRCPAEHHDWLRSFVKKGVKLSTTAGWAMGLAHEYYGLLKPIEAEVDGVVRAERITRPMVLARVLELGLIAYERERKQRK